MSASTAIKKPNIKRVSTRIRISVTNGDILKKTCHIPARARQFVWDHRDELVHGFVKVIYSKTNDFWNAGEFTSYEEFDFLFSQITAKDLIADFAD